MPRFYTFVNSTPHNVRLTFTYSGPTSEGPLDWPLVPGETWPKAPGWIINDGFPHILVVPSYGLHWRGFSSALYMGTGSLDAPSGTYILDDNVVPPNPMPQPGPRIVYGAVALSGQTAQPIEVPAGELREPHVRFEDLFVAVHRWAGSKGYAAAYPNFESRGQIHGAVALRRPFVDIKDIPLSELGGSTNTEKLFRGVHKWAIAHGFVGGYPNFEHADHGRGMVFQAVLFTPGSASVVEVSARDIGKFETFPDRMRAVHRWGTSNRPNGAVSAYPNCEERHE